MIDFILLAIIIILIISIIGALNYTSKVSFESAIGFWISTILASILMLIKINK
jgi:hypothetical protein